jgi:hypothetical protein
MEQVESKEEPVLKDLFGRVERYTYIAVGGLLVVAVVIALAGAVALLWHGALDWTNTSPVFEVVDRLLFILMLVEIMHTVSGLTVEPFLVVGLIASIRRVLVITLETSEAMRGHAWSDTVSEQFHASMIELGVLGGLILVMVSSIFLLHRIPAASKQA